MININKIYNTVKTKLIAKLERCNVETKLNEAIKKRRTKHAKKEENNINEN